MAFESGRCRWVEGWGTQAKDAHTCTWMCMGMARVNKEQRLKLSPQALSSRSQGSWQWRTGSVACAISGESPWHAGRTRPPPATAANPKDEAKTLGVVSLSHSVGSCSQGCTSERPEAGAAASAGTLLSWRSTPSTAQILEFRCSRCAASCSSPIGSVFICVRALALGLRFWDSGPKICFWVFEICGFVWASRD